MLPDLSSVRSESHFGGTHTRNRKIAAWQTCQDCPVDKKGICSTVCPEMERYLAANGRTITHNSPTQKQAMQTVEEMTTVGVTQGEHAGHSLSSIRRDNPHITVTETPESLLTVPEEDGKAETRVLQLIVAFSKTEAKGDARRRSILESAIVLHCLESHTMPRVAEILAARFPEYEGYDECFRRTGPKAGQTVRTSKGACKVRRIVQSFGRYIREHGLRLKFVAATESCHQRFANCVGTREVGQAPVGQKGERPIRAEGRIPRANRG